MSLRDFALLVLVCVLWGLNMVVSKVAVSGMDVPPVFYAMLRSAVLALAVFPWLLPMPKPRWRTFVVGVLMGGGSFALLFVGLKSSTPSAAAVVTQLGVPMVTILSIFMLGEQVRWRRGLGIGLTFAGVVVVMWDPDGMHATFGLLLVAVSSLCAALGAVLMKQMEGVSPLRYQAWVGFASMLVLIPMTLATETYQVSAAIRAGWPFVVLMLYSALCVSLFAHSVYYWLIQRYEANLIAPLTLMSPLMSIGFGVWLTGDPFNLRMAAGTALALLGVLIIAVRRNITMPKAILFRKTS
jgi:O-acetylserine/cysteine efflux transporter